MHWHGEGPAWLTFERVYCGNTKVTACIMLTRKSSRKGNLLHGFVCIGIRLSTTMVAWQSGNNNECCSISLSVARCQCTRFKVYWWPVNGCSCCAASDICKVIVVQFLRWWARDLGADHAINHYHKPMNRNVNAEGYTGWDHPKAAKFHNHQWLASCQTIVVVVTSANPCRYFRATTREAGLAGVANLEKTHNAENTNQEQWEKHEDSVCVRDHMTPESFLEAVRWEGAHIIVSSAHPLWGYSSHVGPLLFHHLWR